MDQDQKYKVFVVDDSKVSRRVITTELSNVENIDIKEFSEPLAALDAIKEEKPNMLVTDMVMPKMNGREAFGELKKLDDNVNVILSSGYMAEGEAGDLLESGAKCFLRKPYKMIDLARKIREILD